MGFFWGLIFGPGIILGFVGSPRDFFGFRFLPPFDHPRHLKLGAPPWVITIIITIIIMTYLRDVPLLDHYINQLTLSQGVPQDKS